MVDVGWMTFHRWVFDTPQRLGVLAIARPDGAVAWICGPDSPLGPDGTRTGAGAAWGGVAFHADRATAEALLDGADERFADLPRHGESFHCLLRPFRFSGAYRLLEASGATLELAEKDPGGPVAVLTSAGYDDVGPGNAERMRDFRENVDCVRNWYDGLDDTIVHGNFITAPDGMTFS